MMILYMLLPLFEEVILLVLLPFPINMSYQVLKKNLNASRLDPLSIPQSAGKMSKRLGGITGFFKIRKTKERRTVRTLCRGGLCVRPICTSTYLSCS